MLLLPAPCILTLMLLLPAPCILTLMLLLPAPCILTLMLLLPGSSAQGYCGVSAAFCGAGCQPRYGKCTNASTASGRRRMLV